MKAALPCVDYVGQASPESPGKHSHEGPALAAFALKAGPDSKQPAKRPLFHRIRQRSGIGGIGSRYSAQVLASCRGLVGSGFFREDATPVETRLWECQADEDKCWKFNRVWEDNTP